MRAIMLVASEAETSFFLSLLGDKSKFFVVYLPQ
jgi:hypothetical protein